MQGVHQGSYPIILLVSPIACPSVTGSDVSHNDGHHQSRKRQHHKAMHSGSKGKGLDKKLKARKREDTRHPVT